jgi:hypothetical protein
VCIQISVNSCVTTEQVGEVHEITEAIPQAARVCILSASAGAGPPASDGLLGLGGTADPGLSPAGGFPFPVLGFFFVFFRMVRRQRYIEVRIRSSLPYPRSDGAPSTGEGRMESCLRRIS